MKKIVAIIFALSVVGNLSFAQYPHGLPANSSKEKPQVVRGDLPYSYSAIIDFGSFKQEERYDAETKALYRKDIANNPSGKYTLTLFTRSMGKVVGTLYEIDPKEKTYFKMMADSTLASKMPGARLAEKLEIYEGRWIERSSDGKWWTDADTGITLREDCDHTKTLDIKLEPQPKALFQIPEGYKDNTAGFEERVKEASQNPRIVLMNKLMSGEITQEEYTKALNELGGSARRR